MTEYEAKLILDVRISRFDHAEDVNEALEIAKAALEKQTPVKCTKDDCDRDCCPSCGWIIGYGDTIQPHCHNCGQALDWSD